MIVTRKHLPRRTFLRGLGTAVALPWLDAMVPAFAAPADRKTPVRLIFGYVPNGMMMKDWTPTGVGKDFEFTRILKPLENLSAKTCWCSPDCITVTVRVPAATTPAPARPT